MDDSHNDGDRVVSLGRFRLRRVEELAAHDWPAELLDWARVLRDQEVIAPPGGWDHDNYLELCDLLADTFERWAAELEGKPRSGA
jgi:hypothetical protein